jgi:hypothetical protein
MSRLYLLVPTLCVVAMALAVAADSAHAATADITYTGAVKPGVSCTSAPNVPTATITTNDTVTLTNATGVDATIEVNGALTQFTISPGTARPITLVAGSWSVALAPTCPDGQASITAATIAVTNASVTPSASPSTSASPSAPTRSSPPVAPRPSAKPRHTLQPGSHATASKHARLIVSQTLVPSAEPSPSKGGPYLIAGPETVPIVPSADHGPSYLATVAAIIGIITVGTAGIQALVRSRRYRPRRS